MACTLDALERDTYTREQGIDPTGIKRPENSLKKTSQSSVISSVLNIPSKENNASPHQYEREAQYAVCLFQCERQNKSHLKETL